MNTKIYNAFKWNDSPEKLIVKLKDIRKRYMKDVGNQIKIPLIWKMFEKKENLKGREILFDNDIYTIIREEIQRGLNHPLNPQADAVIYFLDGKIYVHFFGLTNPIMRDTYQDRDFIDYHYQDQVDPYYALGDYAEGSIPVLEKQYDQREKVWDVLLPNDNPYPALNGVTFPLYHENLLREVLGTTFMFGIPKLINAGKEYEEVRAFLDKSEEEQKAILKGLI